VLIHGRSVYAFWVMPLKSVRLNVRLCVMLLIVALVMFFGTACAETGVKSSPVATATVDATSTATASPVSTPTAVTHIRDIRVDSFVCQRFFPGVPNPDGPNEWLNISGAVSNPNIGIHLNLAEIALSVDVLDESGDVVRSVPLTTAVQTLAPGESTMFNGEPVNEVTPTAITCRIAFGVSMAEDQTGPLSVVLGQTTVAVEIFAAP
jgi:hypothetical protein